MKKLKTMKGLCMMLFALGISLPSMAQVSNVSFATGTTTSGILPIYGNYGYSYSQQLYLDSEMGAYTTPQMINKVRFYYVSGPIANSNNWTIYMGNTALSSFAGTAPADWVPLASMQQVFSGVMANPTAGWVEITLTTPFIWDGNSNLVVAIDENQPGYATMTWRKHDVTANRSMNYNNDNTNPDPAAPPTASARFSYVPQTQFNLIAVSDCAGAPDHYGAIVTNDTICEGTSVTVNVNDSDASLGVNGLTISWESRQGAGPWTTMPGITTKSFSTGAMTTTTEYRAVFTCTTSGMQDFTDSVRVVVNPTPTVLVNPTSYAICNEDTTQLIASGADFFTWSPAAGLNSTNSDLVDAYPAITTVYTVTGTTAAGCSNTAKTTIYKVEELKAEASYSPAVVCTPGTPVSITLNTALLPTGISNSGSWQYRFLGADGIAVAQNWSASSSFTFTPTEDSTYRYYYQIRSTSCPESVDSIMISIPVGFGADADIIHYDCNNLEGTISLDNIFGQALNTAVYSNPAMATTADVVTTGNASITAGRLVLTPSALSNSGTGTINVPGFAAGVNNSLDISFKLTMDQTINVGADGLSYSFGNDVNTAFSSALQNGRGTKLRLSFDAIDNSSENNNHAGIYLVYGFTGTNSVGAASTGTLAYSTNTALWMYKTDIPVRMIIDASGRVQVFVDNVLIFNNIQLPPAYQTADVTAWKHMFSAQTGGFALRQAITDFKIDAPQLSFGITPGNTTPAPTSWQAPSVFEGLMPGEYNIWISRDNTGTCLKNIGTYEILNLNPVVDLGEDVTLCSTETLTLDAGNPGASYVWSGTNEVTQTLAVDESGTYVAYVTDTSGCVGIGTIDVNFVPAPVGTGIFVQGTYPTLFVGVSNPQNASTYSWDFGDGNTLDNGPSSVVHTYAQAGTYNITVELNSAFGCATTTIAHLVNLVNTAGIEEQTINGLNVYPNPATDRIYVSLPASQGGEVTVYNVTGAIVSAAANFETATQIDVTNWESGVYFVHIQSEGATAIRKVVVQ
jgi:hypothetical protein